MFALFEMCATLGDVEMAHGYPDGKYRGGQQDRSNSNSGPGKNAEHDGENHSQTAKGNRGTRGDQGRGKS